MSRIVNRPLTKPREPHRLADLVQVIAAILLLIVPALLYASQRAKLHLADRRIAALERQLLDLEEQRQLLRIELASELDPRRLHERAREIAALDDPTPAQVAYLPRPFGLPYGIAELPGALDGHR